MPSSDQIRTETVQTSSDHYGTTKVVPPSDHLHIKRTQQHKLVGEKTIYQTFGGPSPPWPHWLRHWLDGEKTPICVLVVGPSSYKYNIVLLLASYTRFLAVGENMQAMFKGRVDDIRLVSQ